MKNFKHSLIAVIAVAMISSTCSSTSIRLKQFKNRKRTKNKCGSSRAEHNNRSKGYYRRS